MKRSLKSVLLFFVFGALGVAPALANTVVIDENGNGFFNGSSIPTIPTGTGPLLYNVGGYGVVYLGNSVGTIFMNQPGGEVCAEFMGACDIITFSVNTILFYSVPDDGVDARGDQGFPIVLGSVFPVIPEIGPEGNNSGVYTPVSGQPGFIQGMNLTYDFVSDGQASPTTTPPIPEPASLTLLGTGLLGLLALHKKKLSLPAN
jgi:hypothetical protein